MVTSPAWWVCHFFFFFLLLISSCYSICMAVEFFLSFCITYVSLHIFELHTSTCKTTTPGQIRPRIMSCLFCCITWKFYWARAEVQTAFSTARFSFEWLWARIRCSIKWPVAVILRAEQKVVASNYLQYFKCTTWKKYKISFICLINIFRDLFYGDSQVYYKLILKSTLQYKQIWPSNST